jgi:multidrug transporter EmrE-like cation transporter
MSRPAGVTYIAVAFLLVAAYLSTIAAIMLISPGAVSMAAGTPLLGGLELAGPYMFLLVAGAAIVVGLGMLRLNNWARRLAALAAMAGVVLLVPDVASAVASFRAGPLFWSAVGVVLRVMVVWYLYQEPVKAAFEKPS